MPYKLWACDICHICWTSRAKAQECEDQGKPPEYPPGLIYGDHTPGTIYADITFAIAVNHIEGHYNLASAWACRDNGAEDSLGEEHCEVRIYTDKLNRRAAHFKRMVAYLRSEGIEPTLWIDKKVTPLKAGD